MTSAPTILATCKQTRFHLLDENPSTEVCEMLETYSSNTESQL